VAKSLIISFVGDSDISAFHTALGQYLNYCQALEEQEPDRIVYLAIPLAESDRTFKEASSSQVIVRGYKDSLPEMLYHILSFA
jgi:hypothetical protein